MSENLETPNIEPEIVRDAEESLKREDRRRPLLLLLILLLLMLCCCLVFLAARYLSNPAPLPDVVPNTNINYPPHYLYSIYQVDKPVAVALSPDFTKIYVAEVGGERRIKIFSRKGDLLGSFGPPHLAAGELGPSYMAVNSDGRVFVADRTQGVIYIYDGDGKYLDSLLTPDLTLKGFVATQAKTDVSPASHFMYSFLSQKVVYALPGQDEQMVDLNTGEKWAPMGVRFDQAGNLLVTDAFESQHRVQRFTSAQINSPDYWEKMAPDLVFGERGDQREQFLYPNTAMTDSRGRIYVSDGNNNRISIWSSDGKFINQFGAGTGSYALNLPRGLWIDHKDHLHIVDVVGQDVKVYDVSGDEPAYLYTFGDFGVDDGLFNFPNDIVIDRSGWLFIADRENNRVQVWSY